MESDIQFDLPEPGRSNTDLHDVWILWATLDYLRQRAQAGHPYVSAKELRDFVRQHTVTEDSRDQVIRCLRTTAAIGQLNQAGSTNRRFFLREITGEAALQGYRDYLEREMK